MLARDFGLVPTRPFAGTGNLRVSRGLNALLSRCLFIGVWLILSILSGCYIDNEDRYGAPPPQATSRAPIEDSSSIPIAPAGVNQVQVLKQYKLFWVEVLPRAYASSAQTRESVLSPVVGPGITGQLLGRISSLQKRGRTSYGHDRPVSERVEWSPKNVKLVLVRGCLDSSATGVMDAKSGRKLTVGIARNPVLVNLSREADGIWRISGFHFPGGQC